MQSHQQFFSEKMNANVWALNFPSSLILAGCSFSGKSSFAVRLAKFANQIYRTEIEAIIWCYQAGEQSVPRSQLQHLKNIQFHKGLPSSFSAFPRNSLIICDDLSSEDVNASSIYKQAILGTHHNNQSLVIIIHNIFTPGKAFKTVARNAHYYVIFNCPRDRSQLDIFFRQIEPKYWRNLRDIFEQEVVNKPFSYLLIDCHPSSQSGPFRYRNQIFPDDPYGQFFCVEEKIESLKQHAETEKE